MSTAGETLYHPINSTPEKTWDGFSWPGFLFGGIWLAIKGLWTHLLICLVVLVVTVGYGAIPMWIYYGFKGNDLHKKKLLSAGYLTQDQLAAKNAAQGIGTREGHAHALPADELEKLGRLRDTGVLTEDEFLLQKKRLLAQ